MDDTPRLPVCNTPGTFDFLAGGGHLGALMRAHDWSTSPLGSPEKWPDALKMSVSICLNSRFPMVLWWGPQFIMLYNDAWRPVLGRTKHPQGLGRPGVESWPEIWDIIGEQLRGVLERGSASWSEDLLLVLERHGYREEAYFTYSYSPIKHSDGTIGGVFSAVNETTARVLSERRLRILRELAEQTADAKTVDSACSIFASVLGNNNPDLPFAGIYLLSDSQGEGLRYATAGLDANEARLPRRVLLHEPDGWRISEVFRTGKSVLIDDLNPRFGGLPGGAWPEPTTSALVMPVARAGQHAGTTAVLIAGINPRRALDGEYRSFLELVSGQMATALSNARAYEEERRRSQALEELDRAKTTFFSNVSHEFRTPLTLMLGPLEESLSQGERLPPEERERVAVVHRNGLRLLKLVNTLLDFSRIEAGRYQATYVPTDFARFTAELASNFRSVIERAGVEFVVDCEALHERVYLDREMWEKVVLNLLSNAFKFTFEGRITIGAHASADRKRAEIVVRDTGIGIPSDELPRIFERFRRIEGARGRSFEGSGIGLALVQELVKLHGGEITVESSPGVGTTFTVSVPFGISHLPSERIGSNSAEKLSTMRAQAYVDEAVAWLRGSSRENELPSAAVDGISPPGVIPGAEGQVIFVADDNGDMRNYTRRLLRSAGFEVEAFADGQELLEACDRRIPHLVLSDVMMPRLDGFGLLAALRASSKLRDVPVLLLSARAGDEAKVEGLSSGADDYLTKPFSARELIARIEANLKMARLRRASEQVIRDEAALLEQLNQVGNAIAAEIDLERAVQIVTDAATKLSGAAFGAFFYNVVDEKGESYTLYTLSGAPREAFSKFPQPRNTEVFAPTFRGEAIVRSPDITEDSRFGKNPPYYGHPPGHLPVRSYLAVPVVSHTGEVLGGLFFAHPQVGIFSERAERLVAGIAIQAAIAIDKARLFRSAKSEIERRKSVEAALRESEQSLEAKVEARTAELLAANDRLRAEAIERQRIEEQLRQAQKMEAIGHLTGGVAHDFNNLLTIVIGNIDSLHRNMDSQTPARMRRWVENAMHGAKRAASLTQHLLAFSRRQPLEPKPVELNRLISNLSQMLGRTLGEKVEVQTILGAGLWRVEVDPNQLETSIVNLAVNARDAMPHGGKLTIETANAHLDEAYVAAASEVAAGQYVVVAVSDSGAGMSKEVLQHAFEPFFTTKPTGHGTGLGLSQVYGFVKQSGGHVRLYSEPGQGTTVKIYLPRLVGADADTPQASDTIPDGSGKETVLVVEDDANVREYSTEILRELGYLVVEAEDASSALRHLERVDGIDLLFTDIGLPGLNGRELAEEARRKRPSIKVLYTTGYARNAVVHHGRLDAGVQLIAKPFTYAELASKIRQTLDQTE